MSNGQLSDDAYATAGQLVGVLSTINSNYIVFSNLGFSVPTTASICGIEVEVECNDNSLIGIGASIRDNSVRLLVGGSITGTNHASGADWPGTDGYATYGSNADLWGATLTPADINLSNFGVAISARLSTGLAALFLTPRIDHIRITVYYNNVVPIKLKGFSAKQISNKVKLEWVTATESNNKTFVVERSLDNVSWAPIDSVPGAGNSYRDQYYASFDNSPGQENHYRLKQVDFDGKTELSKVIVVKMFQALDPVVSFSPNPASSRLSIKSSWEIKRVRFFDANSIEVFPSLYGGQRTTKTFDVEHLKAGIYFVRVYTTVGITTKNVIVVK